MTATITTFTVIHIGPHGPEPTPYAVVVAQTSDGRSVAARADGDLSWLAIGNAVRIVEGVDGASAHFASRKTTRQVSLHPRDGDRAMTGSTMRSAEGSSRPGRLWRSVGHVPSFRQAPRRSWSSRGPGARPRRGAIRSSKALSNRYAERSPGPVCVNVTGFSSCCRTVRRSSRSCWRPRRAASRSCQVIRVPQVRSCAVRRLG